MTTDRELLEAAAKAAGIALYWAEDDPECDWVEGNYPRIPDHKVLEKWTWRIWNPLTDDGDALRLAVKLGIEIHPDRVNSEVVTAFCVHEPKLIGLNTYEAFGGDEMAATRRAIVRAAAEIGRSMA